MVGAAVAVLLGASPAALGVIVAEIGAGLCLVIAGGASDWENLKQLYRPGTQKVFEYHLLQFEKAEEYKTMIKNGAADLEADLKGVADALKTARFSDFWDTYRPQIEAHLSGKFAKNDIGYMFTPSPSFGLQRE